MNINQINNTSFKQVFMPGYDHYTDVQKEIAKDISSKIVEGSLEGSPRQDVLLSTMGNKDSLYVFNCKRDYSYKHMQEIFLKNIFVGKYDAKNRFSFNDIVNANKNIALSSIKAWALNLGRSIEFAISKITTR